MNADGPTAQATSASPHRRRAVVAVAVVVCVVVVAVGWRWWSARSYVGTTQRVALEWDCWNGIFWTDAEHGARWWAGHDPKITGTIETEPRTPGGPNGIKHAAGTVRIDTDDTATFVSEAGGRMPLTLDPPGRFHTADCAAQP